MHSGSPGSCGKGQGVTALSSSERGTSGEVGGELVWGVLWNFPARASLGNVLIILSGGGGRVTIVVYRADVGPRVPSAPPPYLGEDPNRTLHLCPSPDWGASEQGCV